MRIGRLPRSNRTHQQVWVIILLLAATCYLQPLQEILRVNDFVRAMEDDDEWIGRDQTLEFYAAVPLASFSILTLFYMWASLHSYGVLRVKLGVRFYITKALVILGYVIFQQVITLHYEVRLPVLPFASGISLIAYYRAYNASEDQFSPIPARVPISIGLLTLYELAMVILIVRRIFRTKTTLKNVDYLRYRTKQIGFRFFLYNSANFYFIFWISYVISLAALPAGGRIIRLGVDDVLPLDFLSNTAGLEILIATYVAFESYVNLPADAIGFRGWIHSRQKPGSIKLAPVRYKKLEPVAEGKHPLDLQSNCFVMETHVEMFNFAWLVYYHQTPKYDGLKQTPGLFSYKITDHVISAETDTHALIVDGSDRIVVAFRGTNSVRNLRTDLQAFHMPCSRVLPTKLDDGDFEADSVLVTETMRSKEFANAKFHKGFALAYTSISGRVMEKVKALYDERERPVYLTGHSLGGALAVIGSFDLFLKLGLEPNELFVSSFGAPRVANASFRRIYNERVPNHWRIVIGPDIVTKLPKVGYQHVGKKVLLTAAGELFIDPNSLEMKHWHGDPASILYHRKASYLLAMKAWCRNHHRETYEPHFWQFPYTSEDSRRFPEAAQTSRWLGMTQTHENSKRIMTLDAMVDALDREQSTDLSVYTLSNWARLTRRALLNERFKIQLSY
eukprot:Plantae.Rhodophyta-Hildenbrandia_rubra.ctg17902.p1 GENE.Plantae.Rhodophyta-Hildenbrandia_rubra.ctg17902~~Plantae.Rhodophyta-Hildenbrandia_rubra.ctg17902.p1  ORF type:complete len:675 (-),score=48.16 Plantae.Rhodophyta-Hildenbrandia_rubra.ctg17902:792-2816(-)